MKPAALKQFSLHTYLCGAILIATGPTAVLMAYQAYRSSQVERQSLQESLHRTALWSASFVDSDIQRHGTADPERWQSELLKMTPVGGFVSVTDARGALRAGSPAPGHPAPASMLLDSAQTAVRPGWVVEVGMPGDALERAELWTALTAMVGAAACILLGQAVATRVGRRVQRTLSELVRQRLSQPGPDPRAKFVSFQELIWFQKAFDEAHLVEERMQADLQDAVAEASSVIIANQQREAWVARERLMQAKLEHSAQLRAEEASRTKDEFIVAFGHELRNALSAISCAIEVLDQLPKQAEADPEAEMGLAANVRAVIARQARQLVCLADELRDAGHVMSGAVQLTPRRLDVAELMLRAVENVRATDRLPTHALRVHTAPVWILADGMRIEQLVNKLLACVLRHTPLGLGVTVGVRPCGGDALIEILDGSTGGLTAHARCDERRDRQTDHGPLGLDVCLTLVRHLAQMHGGTVGAETTSAGRLFSVRFPALSAEALGGEVESQSSSQGVRQVPRRIVVIEQSEDMRTALQTLLEMDGHEVLTPTDSHSGLGLMLEGYPDVVIIEIGLPGLNAFELARCIRRTGYAGQLLALSSEFSHEDVATALHNGFDAHLSKPVDMRKLRQLLSIGFRTVENTG